MPGRKPEFIYSGAGVLDNFHGLTAGEARGQMLWAIYSISVRRIWRFPEIARQATAICRVCLVFYPCRAPDWRDLGVLICLYFSAGGYYKFR